jgi:hypothetical protein
LPPSAVVQAGSLLSTRVWLPKDSTRGTPLWDRPLPVYVRTVAVEMVGWSHSSPWLAQAELVCCNLTLGSALAVGEDMVVTRRGGGLRLGSRLDSGKPTGKDASLQYRPVCALRSCVVSPGWMGVGSDAFAGL